MLLLAVLTLGHSTWGPASNDVAGSQHTHSTIHEEASSQSPEHTELLQHVNCCTWLALKVGQHDALQTLIVRVLSVGLCEALVICIVKFGQNDYDNNFYMPKALLDVLTVLWNNRALPYSCWLTVNK